MSIKALHVWWKMLMLTTIRSMSVVIKATEVVSPISNDLARRLCSYTSAVKPPFNRVMKREFWY